jgi:hypothetical protein
VANCSKLEAIWKLQIVRLAIRITCVCVSD